ncbi:hypothetical protein SAMN02910292_01379 [Lachnospiraceae bacterium XBB2008]|nr:hypothetical protein SAMN02910292_01379 [Lachnospiraceae bacterium XBB2008]
MSDFDISSLTDYSSALLSNTQSTAVNNAISSKVNSISKDSTDAELLDACKQFEAYLWEQVYKNVDKTTNVFGSQSDGSYAGNMVNMFSDNLIQEVSKMSVGEGDNSLAMRLYEQLKRNYGIGVTTPEEIDKKE